MSYSRPEDRSSPGRELGPISFREKASANFTAKEFRDAPTRLGLLEFIPKQALTPIAINDAIT